MKGVKKKRASTVKGKSRTTASNSAKVLPKKSVVRNVGRRSRQPPPQPLEIDWKQFEGGRNADRFEDMAVDLFVTQFGESKFTPNARRSGPDGGVDGLFDGSIDRIPGPWKIAVAVRQSFTEVKKKVRHENELARKAGQRGLLFITSFDASAVQVSELRALAKKGLKAAHVWSQAKLDRLLRDEPWLRQVYFGHQLVPGFVPVGHPCELDEPGQPDIELVGRSKERSELREFTDGDARIALLVADGGTGKTRLLRALPEILWGTRPRRSVWLRRPGQGAIDHAFLNGLPAGKPMILVLDDGAQALPELLELARLAADQSIVNAKLVVSIRAVDREAALRELARFRDKLVEIPISDLAAAEGARIAQIECRSISSSDATRIAQAFGSNLFLLRAAARQVAVGEQPGTVVNDEHIRRLIAARLIDEAERHLASLIDRRATLAVLSEASLNAPLEFERTETDVALATLVHARVLRRVGNTLRFRRDVEGDLLLAYLLELPAERARIEQLFAPAENGESLLRPLRNLSAAGRGYAATMIRRLVQSWLPTGAALRQDRLQLLPYCAEAAPQEVADLCFETAEAEGLTTNEVASIVGAVGRTDAVRALRLLWRLASLDASKAPFAAHNLINGILNPWFHGPDELDSACRVVEGWLTGTAGERQADVLSTAIAMFFRTVASWDTSDGATFTMHEQALPAAPKLLAVRRAATSLLATMLAHDDRSVRLRAVGLLGQHGAPNLGRVSTQAFNATAALEFRTMIPTIEARLAAEEDTQILAALWATLATRWAAGRPAADDAAQLLLGNTEAPAAAAFRYGSRSEWFYSFDEVFAEAPAKDRWPWWVRRFLHSRSNAECTRVVRALCERYRTASEVAHCLSALGQADRPQWIIDEWCRQDPSPFAEAVGLISHPGSRLHAENAMRRLLYELDPRRVITDLLALPQPVTLEAVDAVLNNSIRNEVSLAVDVGRFLAEQADVTVRRRGLDCVQHRDDADAGAVLDILQDALRDGDWGKHWDAILYALQKPERVALIAQRAVLIARIEERFLEGKEFVGDEWHEERVLELLYGEDDARRLDLLGRLLVAGTFGAIQEVARLTAVLATDPIRFNVLVDRAVEWAGVLGDAAYDTLESLFEAALGELAPPAGAQERSLLMLQSAEPVVRMVGLLILSLHQGVPEVCAVLAQRATDPCEALRDRATSALWSKRWPRGGWSRNFGEPPAQFVALRDGLRGAQELTSGPARRLVTEVLLNLEQAIADYALEDEEVLLPR